MGLKLKWKNLNAHATSIKIYRSLTGTDKTNPGTPLVTLGGDQTEYTDTSANYGITYKYLLCVDDGVAPVWSPERTIKVEHRRGYGPNDLQWGDANYGYFGLIPAGEFFTPQDILNAGIGGGVNGIIPAWHKFIRNGKICYVPDRTCGYMVYNTLYAMGLVFGVDGPGPANMIGGLAQVNQARPMEFNGEIYYPRLPRGWFDKYEDLAALTASDWPITGGDGYIVTAGTDKITDHDALASVPYNEWEDFFCTQVFTMINKKRGPNVANGLTSALIGTTAYGVSGLTNAAQVGDINRRKALCQERKPGATAVSDVALTRGFSGWTTTAGAEPAAAVMGRAGSTQGNYAYGARWFPVLELQDAVAVIG